MNKLIIEIRGGTVIGIHTDIPSIDSTEIILMDRDNEKLDIDSAMWNDHMEREIQENPDIKSIDI